MKLVSSFPLTGSRRTFPGVLALLAFMFVWSSLATAGEMEDAISLLDAALNCPTSAYTRGDDWILDRGSYAGGRRDFLSIGIWRRHLVRKDGEAPHAWGEVLIAKVDYRELGKLVVSGTTVMLLCSYAHPQCIEVSTKLDGETSPNRSWYDHYEVSVCDGDAANNIEAVVGFLKGS